MFLRMNEIILNKDQYMKMASDYNIMSDMYEMKRGHSLSVDNHNFKVSFTDRYTYDLFIGYIYKPYLMDLQSGDTQ